MTGKIKRGLNYRSLMAWLAAAALAVGLVHLVWVIVRPDTIHYVDRPIPETQAAGATTTNPTTVTMGALSTTSPVSITTAAATTTVSSSDGGNVGPLTMLAGTTVRLDPNTSWVCSGDIAVNGAPQYDADETTGLVIVVPQGALADVLAPWGAFCHPASTDTLSQVVDQLATATSDRGCGGSCDTVLVVTLH